MESTWSEEDATRVAGYLFFYSFLSCLLLFEILGIIAVLAFFFFFLIFCHSLFETLQINIISTFQCFFFFLFQGLLYIGNIGSRLDWYFFRFWIYYFAFHNN
jgi:hypothetical protein